MSLRKVFLSLSFISVLGGCASSQGFGELASVHNNLNHVPYVEDDKNYGMEEYLATPDEFMKNGGDCEDYSIAKYHELRKRGYPAEDMWVVMGHERGKGHAVLIVEVGERTMVLDNNKKHIYPLSRSRLRPAYRMNETGVFAYKDGEFDSEMRIANLPEFYVEQIERAFATSEGLPITRSFQQEEKPDAQNDNINTATSSILH